MNRKHLIIVIVCAIAALTAAVGTGIYLRSRGAKTNEILSTEGAGYAEEEIPHADPMIVGKWQNTTNPQWYKVYYDDFDEDEQLFWGKEWNEAEDIQETDLSYHGNGWFRWRRSGDKLIESYTMDVRDVPIAKEWKVLSGSLPDSLIFSEASRCAQCYRFGRVNN